MYRFIDFSTFDFKNSHHAITRVLGYVDSIFEEINPQKINKLIDVSIY